MSINVGDTVPNISFTTMTAEGPDQLAMTIYLLEKELLYSQSQVHLPNLLFAALARFHRESI